MSGELNTIRCIVCHVNKTSSKSGVCKTCKEANGKGS